MSPVGRLAHRSLDGNAKTKRGEYRVLERGVEVLASMRRKVVLVFMRGRAQTPDSRIFPSVKRKSPIEHDRIVEGVPQYGAVSPLHRDLPVGILYIRLA